MAAVTPFTYVLDRVVAAGSADGVALEDVEQLLDDVGCLHNRSDAVGRGLVSAVVRILTAEGGCGSVGVRLGLVRLLCSLTTLREGRVELFPSHGQQVLSLTAAGEDVSVRTAAPFVEALISLLGEADDALRRAALGAVAALSEYDSTTDAGTVEVMARMLGKEQVASPAACRDALQFLWNVSADVTNKELAITQGVVSALVPQLSDKCNANRRLAAGLLMSVTTSARGKTAAIAEPGLVDAVCGHCAEDTPAGLRRNATNAVRNIVENPAGRSACGTILAAEPSVASYVLGFATLAKVIDELLAGPDQLASLATGALEYILRQPDGVAAATFHCLDIVPRLCDRLVEVQHDESQTAVTSECLAVLAAHLPDMKSQLRARLATNSRVLGAVAFAQHDELQAQADVWSVYDGPRPSEADIALKRRQMLKAKSRAAAKAAVIEMRSQIKQAEGAAVV